jgi:hypothetical protein
MIDGGGCGSGDHRGWAVSSGGGPHDRGGPDLGAWITEPSLVDHVAFVDPCRQDLRDAVAGMGDSVGPSEAGEHKCRQDNHFCSPASAASRDRRELVAAERAANP